MYMSIWKKLPITNDIKLGFILNLGVFSDILNDPKNALNVTNEVYEGLIKEIDNLIHFYLKVILKKI